MRAPARLTTISTVAAGSSSSIDAMQRTLPSKVRAVCCGWRVRASTSWPSRRSARTRFWPTNPLAPVTSTVRLMPSNAISGASLLLSVDFMMAPCRSG
jgi:hypothetical protein